MKTELCSILNACALVLTPTLLFIGSCAEEACVDCMTEKCSDLIGYCEQDTNCKCMSDCLGNDSIPGVEGCLTKCDVNERPSGFAVVEECVATACPDSDECSTPSGYTPPDTGDTDTTPIDTTAIDGLGGGSLADCVFDSGLEFKPEGDILQLKSADKNVCVRIEREDEGSGSLANTSWNLTRIHVGPLGEVALVEDSSAMCWYSSHHNFRDWVHVWTGSTHHDLNIIEEGHGGERVYELHTFEQGPLGNECSPLSDGTIPIGPVIPLFPFNP
jgi:hypothetical protein